MMLMRKIPQTFLNRVKSKANSPEQQKEMVERLEAAWRSAEPILEVIEENLNTELHKLIKEDEDVPTDVVDRKTLHNRGQRYSLRKIRDLLFKDNTEFTGE